jgi:hypothetical protein
MISTSVIVVIVDYKKNIMKKIDNEFERYEIHGKGCLMGVVIAVVILILIFI